MAKLIASFLSFSLRKCTKKIWNFTNVSSPSNGRIISHEKPLNSLHCSLAVSTFQYHLLCCLAQSDGSEHTDSYESINMPLFPWTWHTAFTVPCHFGFYNTVPIGFAYCPAGNTVAIYFNAASPSPSPWGAVINTLPANTCPEYKIIFQYASPCFKIRRA